MQDLSKCRMYLCKMYFGGNYECRRFETIEDYHQWCNDPQNAYDKYNTSLQPICTNDYMKIFDRVVLAMRSRNL